MIWDVTCNMTCACDMTYIKQDMTVNSKIPFLLQSINSFLILIYSKSNLCIHLDLKHVLHDRHVIVWHKYIHDMSQIKDVVVNLFSTFNHRCKTCSIVCNTQLLLCSTDMSCISHKIFHVTWHTWHFTWQTRLCNMRSLDRCHAMIDMSNKSYRIIMLKH